MGKYRVNKTKGESFYRVSKLIQLKFRISEVLTIWKVNAIKQLQFLPRTDTMLQDSEISYIKYCLSGHYIASQYLRSK